MDGEDKTFGHEYHGRRSTEEGVGYADRAVSDLVFGDDTPPLWADDGDDTIEMPLWADEGEDEGDEEAATLTPEPDLTVIKRRVAAVRPRLLRALALSLALVGVSWVVDVVIDGDLRIHFVHPIAVAVVTLCLWFAVIQGGLIVLTLIWALIATNRDALEERAWGDVTTAMRVVSGSALCFPLVLGVVDLASRLGQG